MYIRNAINYKLRTDISVFEEGEFESIFIETSDSEKATIIGEIYRIPNTNPQLSLERYQSVMEKLNKNKKRVIIGTDQNFDYLKIGSDKTTSDLLDVCLASNMIPTITKPTCVTHTSATLIDNIYLNHTNASIHSGILYVNLSDHFPVFCFVNPVKPVKKSTEPLIFTYRPMSEVIVNQVNNALRETDWNCLLNTNTVQAYNDFSNKLNNVINIYAPEKTVSIQPRYIIREKWMTKGMMKSSYTLNKLFRKCSKKAKTDPSYVHYVRYINCYNKLKHFAKTTYYLQLFDEFKNNSKQTWKVLNNLIGKQNDKTFVPIKFKHNDELISNPQDIANHFCDYFTNVGPGLAAKIPEPINRYSHYLTKSQSRNPKTLFLGPTDPQEIFKIIMSLKPKKSCGHDNISANFLQKIAMNVAKPISILVNKSLIDGIVPDILKIAKIVPIYKAKEKDKFTNYRPVSLLPTLSLKI
jgi:hypothetical protein